MVLHVLVALQYLAEISLETVDAFYQEMNSVTLLIFWLLIDVCLLLLHVSFIFDCLVYFFSLFCTMCTIL